MARGTESKVIQFQKAKGLTADGVVGQLTWTALQASPTKSLPDPLPLVLLQYKKLGHKIKWSGNFHLNLFGIRNPNSKANSFDDILGCAYTENNLWRVHYWPGTNRGR